MQIKEIAISEIEPWGKNPRRHDVDKIVKSIEKFGFRAPLVVNLKDGKYIVEAGHGRLKAALRLGLDKVPCVIVEDDELTASAYAIADNRLQDITTWDKDGLAGILLELGDSIDPEAIGFTDKELADILRRDTKPGEEPIYPITATLNEQYSYVLVFATNKTDWAWLQTVLELTQEHDPKTSHVGLGRVLTTERFAKLWKSRS